LDGFPHIAAVLDFLLARHRGFEAENSFSSYFFKSLEIMSAPPARTHRVKVKKIVDSHSNANACRQKETAGDDVFGAPHGPSGNHTTSQVSCIRFLISFS
jgi:hypothetical protein